MQSADHPDTEYGAVNGPISVLHFSNTDAWGGASEHIVGLLNGLDQRRFLSALVCTPELFDHYRSRIRPSTDVLALKFDKPHQLGAAFRLARILRRRRVRVLHSHEFYSSLCASPVGWICGVPVIIETPHALEGWRRGWKSRFWVDRMVAQLVDCYVAVSEANRRYLSETKRLPAKKVVVIHNGCDIVRFHPNCRPSEGIRAQFGLAPGDFVLGLVARLADGKGHRFLLQAVAQIRQEVQDLKLICVGDGPSRPQLEAYLRQYRLEETVRFVGHQNDVENWLRLFDVVVFPSLYEAFPLTVLESLAAGKPIIATSVGGIPEVILDSSTGLLVPPGDAEALSRAILKIYRNRQWATTLAENGRRLVEQQFTLDEQIALTQELYFRLCS